MIHDRNRTNFTSSRYIKIFHTLFNNIKIHISYLSVAIYGWKLATKAFADERIKYRRKQQWKIFFSCIINPRFANEWFGILKSPHFHNSGNSSSNGFISSLLKFICRSVGRINKK